MVQAPESRYIARRASPDEWVIVDLCYPDDDYRQTVCTAREVSDAVFEVRWIRDLPLPIIHSSLDDVLELVRGLPDECRATRPIPIPHHPPPA